MAAERCNLLLTLSGYKSYLVGIFQQSSRAGRIVAVDADPQAVISRVAPFFETVPAVSDAEAYLASLRGIIGRHSIDAVAPQNDLDLQLLADHAPSLGARLLGAAPEVVRAVSDKLAMGSFLAERGIASPPTWRVAEEPNPTLPVLVKARWGQGSTGLRRCFTAAEYAQANPEDVAQPLIEGSEYNLDILRASNGDVVSVVPKLKLSMRHGSTDKARSVDAPELLELGVRLGAAVGHLGSIDVDVMIGPAGPMVLDINPRLGGGFPFTAHYCPAYTDALLAVARGESPPRFLGQYARDVTVYRDAHYVTVA